VQVEVNFKSRVRPAESVDGAAVLRVVEDAFGPDEGPTVARLVTALHEAGHLRAALVAEVDGAVVGHVQLNRSWVDGSGAPAVFLEGDPRYYATRGWSPAEPLGFTKPSTRIPDVAFQAVLLAGHEEWMTGALVYCDPFWALDCVGLRQHSS
jgi:putative acetyltransferase